MLLQSKVQIRITMIKQLQFKTILANVKNLILLLSLRHKICITKQHSLHSRHVYCCTDVFLKSSTALSKVTLSRAKQSKRSRAERRGSQLQRTNNPVENACNGKQRVRFIWWYCIGRCASHVGASARVYRWRKTRLERTEKRRPFPHWLVALSSGWWAVGWFPISLEQWNKGLRYGMLHAIIKRQRTSTLRVPTFFR